MMRRSLLAAIAWCGSACTFIDPLGDLSSDGVGTGTASGAACPEAAGAGGGPPSAWIQTNAYVASVQTQTATVQFLKPQMAGGMNVIAIGWNSRTGDVAVRDSMGHCYAPVGEVVRGQTLSQIVYYATN